MPAKLSLLTGPLGLTLVWAKVLTEALLFSLSHRLQQRFAFGVRRRPPAPSRRSGRRGARSPSDLPGYCPGGGFVEERCTIEQGS